MQETGWIASCSGVKLDHYLPPCIGINSKQFTILILEHETLTVIEEHKPNNCQDIGAGENLLKRMSVSHKLATGIKRWNYTK